MMKVEVLYFAMLRERIRLDQETVELPAGARVADARTAIAARHPSVAAFLGQVTIAVNRAVAEETRALREGDELAFLPPVAGGAAQAIRISAEPVTIEGAIAALPGGDHGAVVTFAGIVRRRGHHLADVADEIEREHPGVRLCIHHRVGALGVGETAVAIAAAAAHRAPAFEACRAAIDRLKARAPIWKKEIGESGEAWVGLGA